MKKNFILLFTAGLFLTVIVNGQSDNWIKTTDGLISCKKITNLNDELRLVFENGEKQRIPSNSVLSFNKNGKLYEKMPLYEKGLKEGMKFMKFLSSHEDMRLYEFYDKSFQKRNKNRSSKRYFIYKGEELYIELTLADYSGFEKDFNVKL